jgi:AAA family ATP:ADP antiporter
MRLGVGSMLNKYVSGEKKTPLAWGLAVLAFCVLLGHAVARPGCESLFLEAYGSGMVPRVWLVESGVALLSVVILEWLLQRVSPMRLFVWSVCASVLTVVGLLGLYALHVRSAAFWLYVWKDTYVVVLVELFWVWANVVFDLASAQSLYGFFCAAGSVGAVLGHAVIGFMAVRWGTYHVLWCVPVVLCFTGGLGVWVLKNAGLPSGFKKTATPLGWLERWGALSKSSYVLLLVALVGIMQLVINLVDFQFNQVVEQVFPARDQRTQLLGVMYGVINGVGFVFQISTSWILKVCGVRGVLAGMPVFLSVCSVLFWMVPSFGVMAFGKVAGKALDYSLFRAGKELLYIPLSYEEKTAGKTFVDIFAYRLSKGVASLGVMVLGMAGASGAFTGLLVVLYGVWWALVIAIVRRFYYLKGHA